jgi:hypothetical protein
MATIKQGILGAFSGKVAGVVGSSWKGIPVMKSLPPSVANPRTAKQIEQRSRMSACTAFAQSILADVAKPLNDRFASRMSGFNAFTSRNIANFEGGILSKPEDVKISPMGNKAQLIDAIAAEAKITKKSAHIDIYWYSIEGTGKALGTDIPYAVVYNRTTKEALGFKSVEHRNLGDFGGISLPDDKFSPGDVLDVYLAFLRADGTVVFETAYASTTVTDADA